MNKLLPLSSSKDIPQIYTGTPISDLIEYHNLDRTIDEHKTAKLLIGMCMDHRKQLNIPQNFSYIIRTGGANLKDLNFKISFAIAVGGIRHIVLIGHTQCGMVNVKSKRDIFVKGLVEIGWDLQKAELHFDQEEPNFGIDDEISFILDQCKGLRKKYPNIIIAPMIYKIEDLQLYLIEE